MAAMNDHDRFQAVISLKRHLRLILCFVKGGERKFCPNTPFWPDLGLTSVVVDVVNVNNIKGLEHLNNVKSWLEH